VSLQDQYLAEAETELGARREARAACGHTVMYFAREERGYNQITKEPCGICKLKLQLDVIAETQANGACETCGSALLKDQDNNLWCFECERKELARLRDLEASLKKSPGRPRIETENPKTLAQRKWRDKQK